MRFLSADALAQLGQLIFVHSIIENYLKLFVVVFGEAIVREALESGTRIFFCIIFLFLLGW